MRTTRDGTQRGKRAVKVGVASALACGVLVFAGLALAASSFTDAAGDDNAAPDVTNVTVSEAPDGTLTVAVAVGNYQTLPSPSWFNLWFDLDNDQGSGDAGDEALVRYLASGTIEFYLWDGTELVERSSTGMTGRFEAGLLTLTAPKSAFGAMTSFGILAVSARSQDLAGEELISSDYAPDRGRSTYAGPAQAAFADPALDQDAAPDITSIRVSDTKDGWISFAIATPNYVTLPGESLVRLLIDRDNKESTGDDGAEVLITSFGGEFMLERWAGSPKDWVADELPTRVRTRNAGNVVTIDVHRSELGEVPRFGFAVVTADVSAAADSVLAVDFAPDDVAFYHYTLANKPALRLTATRLSGAPARPRAGKPFAVSLAVVRSDTGKGITSGTVGCRVLLGGRTVRARGTIVAGGGRCALVVPKSAQGAALRGTITVRSGGKSVAATFAYVVR